MRSRFTAFAVADEGHLLRTWHPSTRPGEIGFDAETKWLRLHVLDAVAGGPFDRVGEVEFIATYSESGERHRMQERSRFVREERQWFYVDGSLREGN